MNSSLQLKLCLSLALKTYAKPRCKNICIELTICYTCARLLGCRILSICMYNILKGLLVSDMLKNFLKQSQILRIKCTQSLIKCYFILSLTKMKMTYRDSALQIPKLPAAFAHLRALGRQGFEAWTLGIHGFHRPKAFHLDSTETLDFCHDGRDPIRGFDLARRAVDVPESHLDRCPYHRSLPH